MLAQSCRDQGPLSAAGGVTFTSETARLVDLARGIDDPPRLKLLAACSGQVDKRSSDGVERSTTFRGHGAFEGRPVADEGTMICRGRWTNFHGAIEIVFSDGGKVVARLAGGHSGSHSWGRSATLRVVGYLDAPASAFDGKLAWAEVTVCNLTYASSLYLLADEPEAEPTEVRDDSAELDRRRPTEITAAPRHGRLRSMRRHRSDNGPSPDPDEVAEWVKTELSINGMEYFSRMCECLHTFRDDDAQDAAQDAFVRLFKRRHQFDAEQYGKSRRAIQKFLNTIARSMAISRYWSELSRDERERLTAMTLSHPEGDPQQVLERCPLASELLVAIRIAVSTAVWIRERRGPEGKVEILRQACIAWIDDGISLKDSLEDKGFCPSSNAASTFVCRFVKELLRYLEPLGFAAITDGGERPGTLIVTVLNQFDEVKVQARFTETADLWALADMHDAGVRLVLVDASNPPSFLKAPLHVVADGSASFLFDGGGTHIGRLHAQLVDQDGATLSFVVCPCAPPAGRRTSR